MIPRKGLRVRCVCRLILVDLPRRPRRCSSLGRGHGNRPAQMTASPASNAFRNASFVDVAVVSAEPLDEDVHDEQTALPASWISAVTDQASAISFEIGQCGRKQRHSGNGLQGREIGLKALQDIIQLSLDVIGVVDALAKECYQATAKLLPRRMYAWNAGQLAIIIQDCGQSLQLLRVDMTAQCHRISPYRAKACWSLSSTQLPIRDG